MRIEWGALVDRKYESGVDRGVFYPKTGAGVAWNGLVSVMESVDDTTQTLTYFDGEKVWNQLSLGTFQATLAAFTYPEEFEEYDGHVDHIFFEQPRKVFDLCFRTLIGDAVEGLERGYKLHLVYNALAGPSGISHATLDDGTSAETFSWNISTSPAPIEGPVPLEGGVRPSAHIVIDSTVVNEGVMEEVEDLLYGSSVGGVPHMPTPQALLDLFEPFARFRIYDHGDGSFTAIGPDDAVFLTAPTEFQLSWPSVIMLDEETYQASSF